MKKILAFPAELRYTIIRCRDVAQFGSALRSGRRGRRFESCHPDHSYEMIIPAEFLRFSGNFFLHIFILFIAAINAFS